MVDSGFRYPTMSPNPDALLDYATEMRRERDVLLEQKDLLRIALIEALDFVPAGDQTARECWALIDMVGYDEESESDLTSA